MKHESCSYVNESQPSVNVDLQHYHGQSHYRTARSVTAQTVTSFKPTHRQSRIITSVTNTSSALTNCLFPNIVGLVTMLLHAQSLFECLKVMAVLC